MTKADMIQALLIEETRAWNDLVEVQNKYGRDSDEITPELNRWMALYNLVRDFDLEDERSERIREKGLHKLPSK